MRFMVMLRGSPPDPGLRGVLDRYNEDLVRAGVLLATESLQPGAGVSLGAPPRDEVLGYWLWQMKSLDEAVEWAKRFPIAEANIEIRPVVE